VICSKGNVSVIVFWLFIEVRVVLAMEGFSIACVGSVNELAVEAFDQDIELDTVMVSERVDVTAIGDTKTEMAEGDIVKISKPAGILKEDIISTVAKCPKM